MLSVLLLLLPCLIVVSFLLLTLLLRFDELTLVFDCFDVRLLSVLGAVSGLLTDLSVTVVVDLRVVPEDCDEEGADSFRSVAVVVDLLVVPSFCPDFELMSLPLFTVVPDLLTLPLFSPAEVVVSDLFEPVVVERLEVPVLPFPEVFAPERLVTEVPDRLVVVPVLLPAGSLLEPASDPDRLLVLFPEEIEDGLSGCNLA